MYSHYSGKQNEIKQKKKTEQIHWREDLDEMSFQFRCCLLVKNHSICIDAPFFVNLASSISQDAAEEIATERSFSESLRHGQAELDQPEREDRSLAFCHYAASHLSTFLRIQRHAWRGLFAVLEVLAVHSRRLL